MNEFIIKILRKYFQFLPDSIFLTVLYGLRMGRCLNLKNPDTFTEKLQWLKIHNRKPEYTTMVDKYAVKDYVAGIIGKEHVIPTLGIWDTIEEIEFDALPNKFVLKTTHGGGSNGVVICKDKSTFDVNVAIQSLRLAIRKDLYKASREWPYKNVKKRIIAEEYLEDQTSPAEDLTDYKFYCFNGKPEFCQVIQGRHNNETIDFFNLRWERQPFVGLNPKVHNAQICPKKPENFEEMLEMSGKLSNRLPFSRIDFYEVNGKTYFGEITFFPASGMGFFTPNQYDEILGSMIRLPFVEEL